MFKHYLTTYGDNGKAMVASWFQFNIFKKCYCFNVKRSEITAKNFEFYTTEV